MFPSCFCKLVTKCKNGFGVTAWLTKLSRNLHRFSTFSYSDYVLNDQCWFFEEIQTSDPGLATTVSHCGSPEGGSKGGHGIPVNMQDTPDVLVSS